MLRLLLAGVLVGALAACGPEEVAMGPGADLEGTLGGDAQLEGGCTWLDVDGERYEVLWPAGYEVAFDPVQLLDPEGEVAAEEGDVVAVSGQVADDAVSICMVGTIFDADAVLSP